jgi:hypothetical protein
MLFKLLDAFLKDVPLAGWRTIIVGYLATALPAALAVVQGDTQGTEFYFNLGIALLGPVIHYFRNQADKPEEATED